MSKEEDKFYWIAVCSEHLNEHYNKVKDMFSPIDDEDLTCDHKGCNNRASHEIYKGLIDAIEQIRNGGSAPYLERRGGEE